MSDKLKLNLRFCYGIKRLEAELEFKHKGYAIYAPNGVMKTSFAKTMMDLSQGNKPKDLHFPDRESISEVALNGEALRKEEIFVVHSYDDKFASNQVSTLLANFALRTQYEEIHRSIGESKKQLDKALKRISGLGEKSRENIDPIIEEVFGGNYYEILVSLEEELDLTEPSDLSNVDYKILHDPKVQEFLTSADVATSIEDFAKKYDELTENSPILRRNFQYHNVAQVQQQLKANNFFDAGHKITLADKNTAAAEEVSSDEYFRDRIEREKRAILSNGELVKEFDTFNSKFKNKELQNFRDYITENQYLLPRLYDLKVLRRDLWIQYLCGAREEYKAVLSEYRRGQDELKKIILEANNSRGDWDEVVADFNRRFLYLPFELTIENKADAILKGIAPSIGFVIRDADKEKRYAPSEKRELLRALSTGESRALYILDIMYEVFVRWKARNRTLFIFDDISDSFDYKNKFAIIDFLEGITKVEDVKFLAIILTHNFDFLRTVSSRNICPQYQCRLAFRAKDEIRLEKFAREDISNPFQKWRSRLAEPPILIAYIPFLRNIIEFTKGPKDRDGNDDSDYLQLTRMLHFKDETEALTLKDYETVFVSHLPSFRFPEIDLDQSILTFILEAADECKAVDEGLNLEQKITLSIAIRIWSERYMIAKIRRNQADYDVAKKQTGELVQAFKEQFNNQSKEISLLRRVSLITPANIHINAFMYEPILDMGMGELVKLYSEVRSSLNV
jgi:hypothetical protein